MKKKQQKISVYSYDCKAFVDGIKLLATTLENQNLSDADVRAINCKICQDINNEITACMKLPEVKGCDDYEVINRGATSLCYQSINDAQQKFILKVFEPESFPLTTITPYSDITHGEVVGYNWIDCNKADTMQEIAFLRRFVRFILQEELITILQKNANKEKRNLFIIPKLTLTTKGFAFLSPHFFGETLIERFQKYTETTTSTTEEKICDSVMAVRQAAEYVRDVFHGKHIYHGDIKPSNFFDIKDGESHLIKNIDFDTLVDFSDNNFSGYRNWDVAATTPLFYYADTARVIRNQDFDKIKEYDISALSRMLMYAIICIYGEEENLYNAFNSDSNHFDWIDFFFKSSDVGVRLFNDICITGNMRECDCSERIKLSGLFIYEKIRSLLVRCSDKVKVRIVDAQEFINFLLMIEELFKHNKNDFSMLSDTGREQGYILNGAIRHLNLLYLDNENIRNNKRIEVDYHKLVGLCSSRDWVQYVIEHNYYKQGKNDYDAIDRHLIPEILFEGADEKPLAYDFGNNKSPLEQAFEKAGNKSLFLTAEGGQGKTTMLRSFWLDFLSGKHDTPCIYVDAKLLNQNDGSDAIKKYIEQQCHINLDSFQCEKMPMILLDGANESNVEFRRASNGKCALVTQCGQLMTNGIKIVIGSRSEIIRIQEKKSDSMEQSEKISKEFAAEAIQYIKVCKLSDDQIKHCLGENFIHVENKQPMIDLLRNNMMLHIYVHLKNYYGINVEPQEMKAGLLLDKYFQICFRTRYVRTCLAGLGDKFPTDKELYDEIKSIEEKSRVNIPLDDNEDLIYKKSNRFDDVSKKLTKKSTESIIKAKELKDIDPGTFESLSILIKNGGDGYMWADEIYQEYFVALYLKNIVDSILMTGQCVAAMSHGLQYNAYQFCGEIGEFSDAQYEELINKIKNIKKPCNSSIDSTDILIIAILSGNKFPKNITRIDDWAFSNCSNLTEIIIPRSVKSIGKYAFKDCSNLTEIIIPGSVKSVGDDAFLRCNSLTDVTLQNGVKRIGRFAFEGCSSLTSIMIPGSVKRIMEMTFNDCNNLTCVTIQNGVKDIKNGAFSGCGSITNIVIPKSVKSIGSHSLEDHYWLTSVGTDSMMKLMHGYAFAGCCGLTNITIPKNVRNIGYAAFAGCSKLTDVFYIDGIKLTNIPNWMFDGCYSLARINIPSSVKCIGAHAFAGCDITHIIIPKSVNSIGGGIFYGSNIKEVSFENGIRLMNIPRNAFEFCRRLESIKIPNGVTKIEDEAFFGCHSLASIEIPNSVTSIGNAAFEFCEKLIQIEDGVEYVDKWAVGYNRKKTSIRFRMGTVGIAEMVFAGYSSLTNIEIPNSVTSIGNYAFSKCSNLVSIEIPNSVTIIGRQTFDDCSHLCSIIYHDTKARGKRLFKTLKFSQNITVYCDDGKFTLGT